MNANTLIPLARTTLLAPREAAAAILGWSLTRDVLWTALALIAAVNTFVVLILIAVAQPTMPLPSYFSAPLALFVLMAGILVVYVHVLYWAGLAIGGSGRLDEILALVVWLQAMRAAAQLAVLGLTLLIPSLALFLSLAITVWGLWILLNFIATGLHLQSVAQAFAALVLAGIGLILGLGLMLSLIGLLAQGVLSHV